MEATSIWLASRVILIVATAFTVVLNSHDSVRSRSLIIGSRTAKDLVLSWYQWDAQWYVQVAQSGYFNRQSTAFFPLYPLIVHVLSVDTSGIRQLGVALAISNFACLVALIGIGLLAASETSRTIAGRTVMVTAAYPVAFFLAAPYTEALFLALTSFALLFARRGAWAGAAVVAFLAGLTRPTAMILVLPLTLELIRHRAWKDGQGLPAAIAAVSAVPVAISCYTGFLWLRFGEPLLFLRVQEVYWKRRALPPWDTAVRVVGSFMSHPLLSHWGALLVLDLSLVVLFAGLTLYGAWRQPLAFTAYMAGLLVLCVGTPLLGLPDPLTSSSRFLLAAVPGFILLGRLLDGRRWLEMLLVGGGFMLQAVFLTLFVSGAWLG